MRKENLGEGNEAGTLKKGLGSSALLEISLRERVVRDGTQVQERVRKFAIRAGVAV